MEISMPMSHTHKHERFLSINYAGPVMITKDQFFLCIPCIYSRLHVNCIPAHYATMAWHDISSVTFTWLLGYMTDHVTITPAKLCQIWCISICSWLYTCHYLYQTFVMKFLTDAVVYAYIRKECFKTAIKYLSTTSAFERIK